MGKLRNEFSLGLPKIGGFAVDRLGIGRCEGGPGVPLMLMSPKLQKRASYPQGPKMGGSQNCTLSNFFGFGVTCPWAQNGGCKKHRPPFVPLRGQLPILKANLGVDQN